MPDLTYFDVVQTTVQAVVTDDADAGHTPDIQQISALVTFTPSVAEVQSSAMNATVLLRPVQGRIVNGVLCAIDGTPGIELVAYTNVLGTLPDPLTYRVDYSKAVFDGGERTLRSFAFTALTAAGTVNLNTVTRLPVE